MEKKQSSVDWLFEQLCSEKFSWIKDSNSKIYFDKITSDLLQQAKAMHKEDIEDAWLNGMRGEMIAPLSMNNYKPEAEEYYNETYGGNNE